MVSFQVIKVPFQEVGFARDMLGTKKVDYSFYYDDNCVWEIPVIQNWLISCNTVIIIDN